MGRCPAGEADAESACPDNDRHGSFRARLPGRDRCLGDPVRQRDHKHAAGAFGEGFPRRFRGGPQADIPDPLSMQECRWLNSLRRRRNFSVKRRGAAHDPAGRLIGQQGKNQRAGCDHQSFTRAERQIYAAAEGEKVVLRRQDRLMVETHGRASLLPTKGLVYYVFIYAEKNFS